MQQRGKQGNREASKALKRAENRESKVGAPHHDFVEAKLAAHPERRRDVVQAGHDGVDVLVEAGAERSELCGAVRG